MKKSIIFFTVLTALIMPLMVSCGGERLRIYNWTYYTPDSIIKKFEKEYNVKIIYDQFASNEELYAKLKAGGTNFDIIFPSGDYVAIMIKQDMLEKIDKTKIPNLKNVDLSILQKAIYDPNMDYSVPYYYGAAGIVVNTAKVSDFDTSWSILSREDLRSRITMLDDMREVMGGALSYLGYSVNTTNPAQIEEAKDLINNSWKPNLVKFDAESFGKGYANGDFWVVHGYSEVVFEEIIDNPELLKTTVFFIPNEGGPAYIDNMCIIKGAKNAEMAYKFIDFIHRPDIYAEFVDAFDFPATANIPARQFKEGGEMYTVEELTATELVYDLGEALDLYNDAWFNSIKVGK